MKKSRSKLNCIYNLLQCFLIKISCLFHRLLKQTNERTTELLASIKSEQIYNISNEQNCIYDRKYRNQLSRKITIITLFPPLPSPCYSYLTHPNYVFALK